MRKLWKLAVTTGSAFAAVALVAAPSAQAAGTIPGYGWDGTAHVIVGGGSETTYYVMNSVNRIYQESSNSGCLHNTGVGPAQNSCAADVTNNLFNYQGDTVAQANPTGSGGGIAALNGNGGVGGAMQGTVNPISNPTRDDAAGTTNGSATVTDAAITAGDQGKAVTGTGIPDTSYVGTVTAGVSFLLSSAPDQQLNVNATATGAATLHLSHYQCVNGTTGPNPDFGRSSRGPNTGGGSAPCGNELLADTFWGYGQDGNEVIGFNNHGTMLNALAAPNLTAQTIFQIWNCTGGTGSTVGANRTDNTGVVVTSGSATVTDPGIAIADVGHGVTGTGIPASTFVGTVNATAHTFKLSSSATSQVDVLATASGASVTIVASQRMRWSDVIPGLAGGPGGPNDADIVPWGMNSASGTFGTFNSWVIANANNAPAGWTMNSASCDRKLSSGIFPLENDIKPLINDPAALGTGTSADNPENWMWQGSFANLSAFSFLSTTVRNATTFSSIQARINGNLAGFANIFDRSWPIARVIYHVTRKADADCVKTAAACDFLGHVGPALPAPLVGNDLNVTGGTSGTTGAVREFTRALCRQTSAQQGTDPYTGTNFNTGLTSAIQGAGFTTIKVANRSPGSRCQVAS